MLEINSKCDCQLNEYLYHILYDSMSKKCPESNNSMGTDKRLVIAYGWGWGEEPWMGQSFFGAG